MAEIAKGKKRRKIVIQFPNGDPVPSTFAAFGCAPTRLRIFGFITDYPAACDLGKTEAKGQVSGVTAELLQVVSAEPSKIKGEFLSILATELLRLESTDPRESEGKRDLYLKLKVIAWEAPLETSPPPHWVISFSNLPENKNLCLWIVGIPVCKDDPIVLQPMPFQTIKPSYDVSISSPGSGATVPTTFSASGTGGKAGDPVVGGLEGPNYYTGTVLQGAPNWVVQFANVQPGFPYTLDVVVGGIAATDPSTNITVKA